jgi:predicted nucleotidyltransferase
MAKQYKTPDALARKADLEAELRRILPIIIDKYQPKKIILFGSLATGEVHEWSDIDLAIVKETKLNYFDRLFEIKRLIRSELATDVFVYHPQEFEARVKENHYFMIDEILGKGKVLYERGGTMAEVRQ